MFWVGLVDFSLQIIVIKTENFQLKRFVARVI